MSRQVVCEGWDDGDGDGDGCHPSHTLIPLAVFAAWDPSHARTGQTDSTQWTSESNIE